MTDLHFDVRSCNLHCDRNKWNIELTIFIGDGAETKKPLTEEDLKNGYEHIYIPLTLTNCLVVEDGAISGLNSEPYTTGFDNIQFQDIRVIGKDFHLISMESYWKGREKEKIAAIRT